MPYKSPEDNPQEQRRKRRKKQSKVKATTGTHTSDKTGLSASPDSNHGERINRTQSNDAPESTNVNNSTTLCTTTTPLSADISLSTIFNLQNSEDYIERVMSTQTNTPTVGRQSLFTFGTPQQTGTRTQTNTQAQQIDPPAWAVSIMEDIKAIKLSVSKIDKVEQTVQEIKSKMTDMETKVAQLEGKVKDCEGSCTFLGEEYEDPKKEIKTLKQKLKSQEAITETMSDKVVDLEARSMRENLIFYGLQEHGNENCETIVKDFIKEKLTLNPAEMPLDRVHRLGGDGARKPRPMIAKFHRYGDREQVRKKSLEADIKVKLRDSNQGVGIQWPQQTREARKAFHTLKQREEENGNRVRINGNKFFVNNVLKKKYVNRQVVDVNDGNQDAMDTR